MKKSLGILGGMGPQATADLFQKIIDLTDAASDAEHMRIYIDNHPQIPDRIAAILKGIGDPLPALRESLGKLEACGADIIAIPCVSAHFFLPSLQKAAKSQILDMLELIVQACHKHFPGKRAGLLTSVAAARAGLVSKRLESAGIPTVSPLPNHQLQLGDLILHVKAKQTKQTREPFKAITTEMHKRGADYFVLGCTELPIITQIHDFPYAFLDATQELARGAVTACGAKLAN
jgi:aspartate racemase